MGDMENAGERVLYETSLSSGSVRETMKCETDLEKDQTITYTNGKIEKS